MLSFNCIFKEELMMIYVTVDGIHVGAPLVVSLEKVLFRAF